MRSFLQREFEGRSILIFYEKNKDLNENMRARLSQLLINRELTFIIHKEGASIENLLRKLELSSEILVKLAEEIHSLFDESTKYYFSKGYTVNGIRIPSTGKLIARLNYMRSFLQDVGVLVPAKKEIALAIEPKNVIDKRLDILRQQHVEQSEKLDKAWDGLFLHRQELCNANSKEGFGFFENFPCLAQSFAPDLQVIKDFNRKFLDGAKDSSETWLKLRSGLESLILTKDFRNADAQYLVTILSTLSDDNNKDTVIFMLLASAIRAPNCKAD
ncbi:uncharacterized protein LOC117170638 [Belonocnema kinseyi]|uniref:uncharacterized protein LOC117170638 n=1 Tax=Belonocnema kinseyi TaxID=2817044 RepID=UPI00143DE475|nr:uncharacterized protein LOC117170638 [Belonocnema kinseyi]